jgi:adenylate kinase
MARLGFDLILLGAPAAGKDTQADLLMKKYKLKPVKSGKYFRHMAQLHNKQSELLKKTFAKGGAAPMKLMKEFIEKELSSIPKNSDLIFIGNPRLKPEAQFLKKLLEERNRDFYAIAITLPANEIKRRSSKRMRDVQDWKYVDNRIRMYRLQVSKTLEYLKNLRKLATVNGNQSIEKVAKDITKALNDHQRQQAISSSQAKR